MTVIIHQGDCRELLRTLPAESVHCVVSSPPYWGLRDYGTAQWNGGDAACNHVPSQDWIDHNFNANSAFGKGTRSQSATAKTRWYRPDGSCRCGAIRGDSQLGLEQSLGEHVAVMVDVFREVRRVLRKDGTLWLNYGDSYAASVNGRSAADTKALGSDDRTFRDKPFSTVGGILKPKDLCGIPWRVAFALQEDGWYLRQDIIWSKPNPMPESVTDRCTKAHEYIFLMTKSSNYFYDAEAIAEPAGYDPGNTKFPDGWDTGAGGHGTFHRNGREKGRASGRSKDTADSARPPTTRPHSLSLFEELNERKYSTRNKRSVWEVATAPFSEAHFATFPPALIEPCILAGCPEKCCAKCGAPWIRQVEMKVIYPERRNGKNENKDRNDGGMACNANRTTETLGFLPSCFCNAGTVSGTVLDPFSGAGTTGLVADRLQRNAILIELNPAYAAMAERRINGDAPLFAEVTQQSKPTLQPDLPLFSGSPNEVLPP